MKRDGKKWQAIADEIGTKNEQQCRTRGLVLWNKLRKHCWDKELYEVLAPTGKPGRTAGSQLGERRGGRGKGKKTLRLGPKTESGDDKESKGDGRKPMDSKRKEEIQAIKESYLKKKREKKESEKAAKLERQQIIAETKQNLKK